MHWGIENIPDGYIESLTIHRSESPDGPWAPIGTDIRDIEFFHDHDANVYHSNIATYYKITGNVKNASNDTIDIKPSKVEQLSFKSDTIALNIIRMMNLILRKKNGTPGYFLIKKTWGVKCTSCYDKKLDAVRTSDCGVCYNTKYVGGYYKPIFGFCASDNTGKGTKEGEVMKFSSSKLQLWTSNTPDLKPGDIWADSMGKRWSVSAIVLRTTKLRSLVRQVFIADEIPAGDRIYEIRIPSIFELERIKDNHIWRPTQTHG